MFSARSSSPFIWRWRCCRTCRRRCCGTRPSIPRAAAFFDSFGLRPSHLFAGNEAVILSQGIPLAIASVAAMLVVLMLTRHGDEADAGIAQLLLRWSIAFAAACFLAFPLFTQDFWLSAAWGRMVAAGVNPFHTLFTDDDLAGLPLDHFPMAMSYGPLWAVMSALGRAVIAWDNAIAMALLFKALIAAAWIGSLVLVDRHPARQAHARALPRHRAVRMDSARRVAVGRRGPQRHRDDRAGVAVVSAAAAQQPLGGAGRAGRVGAVQICHRAVVPDRSDPRVPPRAAHAIAICLAHAAAGDCSGSLFLALFFRSMAFFDGMRLVSEWYFLRPSEAVAGIEHLSGCRSIRCISSRWRCFPVIAVYWLAAAVREPAPRT